MRQFHRVIWMMLDQGIFAVSNFIMNVLFARWLSPSDYGMFAVSFSAYLFLTVIHWGAFLEPLLVLSAQIDPDKRRSYITTLGLTHVLLVLSAAVIGLIGYCAAWMCRDTRVGLAIVGAGLGGCLMVTLLTARRLCLVFLSPRVSALVGLLYFIGVLATGSLIKRTWLSWFSLWEIMGFWSLVCSVIIFWLLRIRTTGAAPYPIRKLLAFQSQYAPGAILASLCHWTTFDGVLIILGSMLGLPAVAETKAIFTIANPLGHVIDVLQTSWLVMFAEQGGHAKVLRITALYLVAFSAAVGLLFVAATPLVERLYGGRYIGAAWQLPVYVAAIGLSSLSGIFTSLFKTRGGLWQGFTPVIIGAGLAAGAACFVTIPMFGQPGAVYAIFAGCMASLTLACLIFRFACPNAANRRVIVTT